MQVWRDNPSTQVLPWAPASGGRLAVASLVKWRFPMLAGALQAESVIPIELSWTPLDGVLGWGGRIQAGLARRYAAIRGVNYWSLEDGFLRSVGLGKARHAALSIVVDDLGIHHDPLVPSRLERLILDGATPLELVHAREIRTRVIEERLTKYNCEHAELPARARPMKSKRILLIDQVAGDASIARYGADAFHRMWSDALDQDAEILIRDHPDVLAGFSAGVLRKIARNGNKDTLDGRGAIDDLLAEIDEVWTVSSQFGFEALLRGKRVVTYGMPFYAGWGLTDDRAADPASAAARARRRPRTAGIDDIVAAALVRYPLYFDPIENRRISVEKAMDRLCAWRREADRFKDSYECIGLSRHKRKTAKLFLGVSRGRVSFRSGHPSAGKVSPGGSLPHRVYWGRTGNADADPSRLTIEDGFIRSIGLGSEMARARSLCVDPIGIYYDATRPSLLEKILNESVFDEDLLHRAGHLRRSIVESRISKYNLPGAPFDVTSLKTDRPIALVAEQVPDDASLRFGKPAHPSTLALLASVRATRPDHFILLKRHPDILSGTRRGHFTARDYRKYADHVLERKIEIAWPGISEFHSATSLLGFEALLRGVKTYCDGAPFYSNWGLTIDGVRIERRRRELSIDQLVAGTLILYPSYRCWRSRLPCEPEDVIRDIIRQREMPAGRRSNSAWSG